MNKILQFFTAGFLKTKRKNKNFPKHVEKLILVLKDSDFYSETLIFAN